jgi:hypothetical protein
MSFNSKWFISDIHWISTGEKPNPIPNPKTVGEKPSPNSNPQDPKPAGIRPETDPLPSLSTSPLWHFLVCFPRCILLKSNSYWYGLNKRQGRCLCGQKKQRQGTNLPVNYGFCWGWGLSVANRRGLTALQIVHVRIISTGDALLLWLDYIYIVPLLSILVCQTTATIIVARSVFFFFGWLSGSFSRMWPA